MHWLKEGLSFEKQRNCISVEYSLCVTKNLESFKIWFLNIFKSSKNQILNNYVIEEKNVKSMLGESFCI